jgi:hypothetical protein
LTPVTLADLARLQAALHAEQRAMLADVLARLERIEAQRTAPPAGRLSDADAAALADLLPRIFRRWPGQVFVVADVLAVGELDAGMREALMAVAGADPGKRLGRLLGRAEGVAIGAHMLRVHGSGSPRVYEVVLNPVETPETRRAA